MRIARFAIAALLSLGSLAVAVEPVVATPAYAPVASVDKSDVVKVHYRDHRRHWRHSWRHERRYGRHHPYAYERHYRPWRAERRWRERQYWGHHHRPQHLYFSIDL
ncbi:hypothetical protein EV130_108302 [Rhizobium azibense]|uniref:Uncharacterized protein n=1 Tax=Rhizobium azibense TaxID=1136135 RepID=A0A4R3RP81_9HYPH|nr:MULTISPECIES: hypothetical protein [Rhizobium]TCU23156.1 hypothetical protein EV130_108302 [Rhizobium azibense]TCU36734.1 hypothetical protein EV129_107303 [Rhizobium azibense]